ncbi:MAG: hypothetical protein J5883_04110 [Clostridiales bacterium]|nr:hypothetical protein [Clostridiales bacterium]
MRRDYFTCVFLACICASLFFVCFLPLYFTYDMIIPREFGTVEKISGWAFALSVLLIIPVYAAYKKKFWITAGLAVYGAVCLLPTWILPGMAEKLGAEDVDIFTVVEGFILKAIYGMAEAPFASLSGVLGDDRARMLPMRILPVSLIVYATFQVYRFYRDAYVAEQLDPASVVDQTAKENIDFTSPEKKEQPKPEVLGTVISAPARQNPRAARPTRSPNVNVPEYPSKEIPQQKKEEAIQLGAPKKQEEVIQLGAPKPKDDVIQLGAPKPKDDVIQLPPRMPDA